MSAFELHYATTNKGKVASLERALTGYALQGYNIKIIVKDKLILPEPRSDDVELIACEKVGFAYDVIGKPTAASDAGCYIYSLNGFPKAFVNFVLETIGLEWHKLARDNDLTARLFLEWLIKYSKNLNLIVWLVLRPIIFVIRRNNCIFCLPPKGLSISDVWTC